MLNRSPTTACFLILTLLVSTWPSPSSAANENTKVVVALTGFRNEGGVTEARFREALLKGLEDQSTIRLVPESVTAKYVRDIRIQQEDENRARLENALRNYKKGKEAYEKLRVDEAITLLNASVRGFREGIASLRDNRFLLASHLYLGMALITRGRHKEGREYIRQMIVLDPNRRRSRLSRAAFPPNIVQTHEELTRRVLSEPLGKIQINVAPANSVLYFDGVRQSSSSKEIVDVPVGEHFFLAELSGYKPLAERVIVKPGENSISTKLDEWQPLTTYSFEERRDSFSAELLQSFSTQLAAHVLILGQLDMKSKEDGVAYAQLFDGRSREFSKVESVPVRLSKLNSSAKSLAKKLLGNLSSSGYIVAELAPSAEAPPLVTGVERDEGKSRPLYAKWWFWALVGGAAAAGGAGFLLLRKSDPNYSVLNIENPLAQ